MAKLVGSRSADYFRLDPIRLPATGADLINAAVFFFAAALSKGGLFRGVSLYRVPCGALDPCAADEMRARRGPPISAFDPLDASLMGARYLAVVSRGACIGEQGLF